ncbi:hypothetical protein H634G_04701 [Metarhizium anisopliae BRIP 53293]|uniref:Uncharacterized protein n=1 Tax=Metarhizium anisopliae BRIP 53293 TaxID=1291518 RepID=A0A0D9P2F4_METAN|nr:hypothetical protein H634G_04701 [Metarhizium anisopliae BRIP 53293]
MASAARVSVSMHTLKILARIIAGLWASAGSTNPVVSQPGGDCDADPCLINDSPSENVGKIPERHRCSQGTVLESQQGNWTRLEE